MKARIPVRFVLALGLSVSIGAASATSPLAEAAAPSASASASAAPSASAIRPHRDPPEEALDKQEIPKAPSAPPTLDEWKTATRIEVTRRKSGTSACRVFRVREWLKVKCDMSVGAIHQHLGTAEGVSFWISPTKTVSFPGNEKNGGELLFPMRLGDRRLLQFFELRHDMCVGVGFSPSVIVDETWLEGDASPTVVLR